MKTVAAKLSLLLPPSTIRQSLSPTERDVRIRQIEMIHQNELRRKATQRLARTSEFWAVSIGRSSPAAMGQH